ncbi:unnamed protein product [Cylicocyclus nassatus]|uniref:Uncharacterized protein n=1 Tax=Cylicocyclus nassatus TaxID=53992 RepID=A0AA36DJB6_CYLNA|nr:unnamed protein product [Cylicocyclus nassatus]
MLTLLFVSRHGLKDLRYYFAVVSLGHHQQRMPSGKAQAQEMQGKRILTYTFFVGRGLGRIRSGAMKSQRIVKITTIIMMTMKITISIINITNISIITMVLARERQEANVRATLKAQKDRL